MRQKYVLIDEDGLVVGSGYGPPPEGAIIMDPSSDLSEVGRMYVDGENGLVSRPRVSPPLFNDGELTLPQMPVGSLVQIVDTISDEILFTTLVEDTQLPSEVITFPDAGAYCVMITPPPPYLPTELRFSV